MASRLRFLAPRGHAQWYRLLRISWSKGKIRSLDCTPTRTESTELVRQPGSLQPALHLWCRGVPHVGPRMRPSSRPWRSGWSSHTIRRTGFHRLDFSLFKDFRLTERFKLQFRSEFFNILNHPNFNAPGFGGNGVVAIGGANNLHAARHFGEIGSTRDAPYDPRQIQFALKLYF